MSFCICICSLSTFLLQESQESQCSKLANFTAGGGMKGEQNTSHKRTRTRTYTHTRAAHSCCVVFGSLRSCSMCSSRKVCETEGSRVTAAKHRGGEYWKATKHTHTRTTNTDITTRPPTSHVQAAKPLTCFLLDGVAGWRRRGGRVRKEERGGREHPKNAGRESCRRSHSDTCRHMRQDGQRDGGKAAKQQLPRPRKGRWRSRLFQGPKHRGYTTCC